MKELAQHPNVLIALKSELKPNYDEDLRLSGPWHNGQHWVKTLEKLLTKDRIKVFKQLAHLIAAAHQHRVDVAYLFFVCRPHPSHILHLFSKKKPNSEQQHSSHSIKQEVTARYADGSQFELHGKACVQVLIAGYLVAELLGFSEFISHVDAIAKINSDFAKVDEIAVAWANEFDRYRQQRGGSGHEERQFKLLTAFLHDVFDGGRYTYLDIQSNHVLDFWRQECHSSKAGLQRYTKAHELFVIFVEHFYGNSHDISSESSIFSSGDFTLDTVLSQDSAVQGCSPQDDWQRILAEYPQIKILNKTELNQVAYLADMPPPTWHLIHSALRAHCFASLQNKLIDASRRSGSEAQIQHLLSPQQSHAEALQYADALWQFAEAIKTGMQKSLAAAYVLITHQHSEGLRLIYTLDVDLGGAEGFERDLIIAGINPRELQHTGEGDIFDTAHQAIYQKLQRKAFLPDHLTTVIKQCRSSYQQLSAQHFLKKIDQNPPHLIETVASLAEQLPGALQHLRLMHQRLKRLLTKPDQQMTTDLAVMLRAFADIYQTYEHRELATHE